MSGGKTGKDNFVTDALKGANPSRACIIMQLSR